MSELTLQEVWGRNAEGIYPPGAKRILAMGDVALVVGSPGSFECQSPTSRLHSSKSSSHDVVLKSPASTLDMVIPPSLFPICLLRSSSNGSLMSLVTFGGI